MYNILKEVLSVGLKDRKTVVKVYILYVHSLEERMCHFVHDPL